MSRVCGWTMYLLGLVEWFVMGGGICVGLDLRSAVFTFLVLGFGGAVGLVTG